MSTQVRTPDVTGALWRLPPILRGLAVSEASHPVYLFISSLLLQKGPMAPAMAVMAPQQTPVVMVPQGLSQAPSQPVQPPQSGIAAASGAPVVSQVCFCVHYTHRPPCTPPSRVKALSHLPGDWLCSGLAPDPQPYTAGCASKVSHMPTHLRSSIHTSV